MRGALQERGKQGMKLRKRMKNTSSLEYGPVVLPEVLETAASVSSENLL